MRGQPAARMCRRGTSSGHAPRPASRRAVAHSGAAPADEWAGHNWHRLAAGGARMSTYPDHILRVGSQHLADLKRKTAEFEQQLWDAHESLEQEIEQTALIPEAPPVAFVPEAQADAFVPEAPAEALVAEAPAHGFVP